MSIDALINQMFEIAETEGFSEYEAYVEETDALDLQSFDQEIIKFASSTTRGINFRGIWNGRVGSAYSETIEPDTAREMVSKAKAAATLTETDDIVFMYGEKNVYSNLQLVNPILETVSTQRKVDLVLRNEKEAMDSGKLDKIFGSNYGDGFTRRRIVNSHGLDVSYERNQAMTYMEVIKSEKDQTYSAFEFEVTRDFDKLENAQLPQRAIEKITAKLGAKPIPSGQYAVILENQAAASLLSAYLSAFSAEAVQKGMSLLKDKVGTVIGTCLVNLIDDPTLENGIASAPFDGEGVPCYRKYMIKSGRLETLLHNLKTAHKDQVKTTGNASRGSYKANIGVSHSNAYLETGTLSFEDLLSQVGTGLLITELDGLHAGTNAISGDFSLGARGFLIEDGRPSQPVNQIVVSGNFFSMLSHVIGVADDLKFWYDPVGSPSIAIESLSIAGQ